MLVHYKLFVSLLFVSVMSSCGTKATTKTGENEKKEMKNMNTQKVKIDVWSDVVCPFCYLGKNKLEQAVKKLNAQDKVEIEWHSFQLDSDFPMGQSVNSTEYLAQKKHIPTSQIKGIQDYLTMQGKNYGIDFQFEKSLTFNTFNAHRLLQWSKTLHRSNEMKAALMYAYFTEGADLSKNDVLLNVVAAQGLDVSKAKEILASNTYHDEVEKDLYEASKLGINGVPFFLINEKQVISGAQEDSVFESVISNALKNLPSTNSSNNGATCTPAAECK
jgi:predicted DsbA family dithiol-disulfide isomerase